MKRTRYDYGEDIRTVVIKDGVTGIGDFAFWGCNNLVSITIPDSVTSIGRNAFRGCSSLSSSITFPEGLTSIGFGAFSDCTSLTTVTIKEPTPPSIKGDSFEYVNQSIPVYVPAGSIDAYRNSRWGWTFSNIQPM